MRAARFGLLVSSLGCSCVCFPEIHKIFEITHGKYSRYFVKSFAFTVLTMSLESIFTDKIGSEFYCLW